MLLHTLKTLYQLIFPSIIYKNAVFPLPSGLSFLIMKRNLSGTSIDACGHADREPTCLLDEFYI